MLRMNIKSRKPGRANMTHKEVDNRWCRIGFGKHPISTLTHCCYLEYVDNQEQVVDI